MFSLPTSSFLLVPAPLLFLTVHPSRFPLWDWIHKKGLIQCLVQPKEWKAAAKGLNELKGADSWGRTTGNLRSRSADGQASFVDPQQIHYSGFLLLLVPCFLPCPITAPPGWGSRRSTQKPDWVIVILWILYRPWSQWCCIGSESPGHSFFKNLLAGFNNVTIERCKCQSSWAPNGSLCGQRSLLQLGLLLQSK